MKWDFLRLFNKPVEKRVEIVRRFASSLRLTEWRANKDTVKIARKFLDDPDFKMLEDVLRNENPLQIMLLGKVPIEERAIMQARIEGYCMALNNLEALGVFEAPKQSLQETFTDPLLEEEK